MAKSIRISDEFYDIALHAGEAMGRSLAQQLEHWARLGAALDAAGITFEQMAQLLHGNTVARERVVAALTGDSSSNGMAMRLADKALARRRQKEAEVAAGERKQSSLFLFNARAVRAAKLEFAPEKRSGAKGW